MKYYINVFFIYSIIGYIFESILKLFIPNMHNGILFGPWVPVYGIGCSLIIIIMRFVFNRIKVNRFFKIFLVFIISMITLTLLEFIGGNLIELMTNKVYWDYSNLLFNFGHYIALEISLVWGIMSLIIIYVIKPKIDLIIRRIPSYITYVTLTIFIIDVIMTVIMI